MLQLLYRQLAILGLGTAAAFAQYGTDMSNTTPAAGVTIALVTGQHCKARAGGLNTQTCTLPGSTTVGNLIIVMMNIPSGKTITCTDNGSPANTYTQDDNVDAASDGHHTYIFSAPVTHTSTIPSCTMSGGTGVMAIAAAEFSNSGGWTGIDKKAQAGNTNSVNVDSGNTATTTAANELLIGGMGFSGVASTVTELNSFTRIDLITFGSSQPDSELMYNVVSTTGAYKAAATLSVSNIWTSIITTYK